VAVRINKVTCSFRNCSYTLELLHITGEYKNKKVLDGTESAKDLLFFSDITHCGKDCKCFDNPLDAALEAGIISQTYITNYLIKKIKKPMKEKIKQ
jgi:hypothetical protein